ncbi:hypothetical protein [Parageobacillus thermoglucosidasius]|nr:hypothetical protein [Parageobacillus thermoglucosidasius]MED4946527.1 hypothetical protein [Parageobacillus thermoglucosidasius]MED4984088.1 hypothetical protein [Parageobacillus thermoglucosidasius]
MNEMNGLFIGLIVLFLPLYSLVISLILGKWSFPVDDEEQKNERSKSLN